MKAPRYTVPTWLLLTIALAAFIALVLLPTPASAETLPPPLPLDELPETGTTSDNLTAALAVLSVVVGAAVLAYAHLALSTDLLERARAARARRRV